MKKIVKLCTCGMIMAMALTGCTGNGTNGAASGSEASSSEVKDIDPGTITLGEYKGIEITAVSVEVTEEEVEQKIQSDLAANPDEKEITGRAAQSGDTVNIDYVGKKDGEEFEGGSGTGYDLKLGSGNFIPGFEDGVTGMKIGETKEIEATFPEDYKSEELAGQKAVFTVTVNSIKEVTTPIFNDVFVERVSQFKDTEEYRADVRKSLEKQKKTQAENQQQTEAIDEVVKNSQIELNPEAVDQQYTKQEEYFTSMVAQYGMSLEDYAGMYGMDMEAFEKEIRSQCEEALKENLVVDAVAKKEKMKIKDKDRELVAKQNKMSVSLLIEQVGKEAVDKATKNILVKKFLVENAKIVDKKEEETTEAASASEASKTETSKTSESEASKSETKDK